MTTIFYTVPSPTVEKPWYVGAPFSVEKPWYVGLLWVFEKEKTDLRCVVCTVCNWVCEKLHSVQTLHHK